MMFNAPTDAPSDPTPAPLNGSAPETTLEGDFPIEVDNSPVSTDPSGVHVPPPAP